MLAGESHHLGLELLTVDGEDVTARTDGHLATDRLQRQPDHACQPALDHERYGTLRTLAATAQALCPQPATICLR